jgi:mannitol-1-phosphate 5-dehydrogenase
MNEKMIVIWGAGKIGRGYVAHLFHRAGWRIVLVAKTEEFATQLNHAGRYTILQGKETGSERTVVVDGFRAVWAEDPQAVGEAIEAADIVAVAAYPRSFDSIARQLAPGLLRRLSARASKPLDILMCVNLMDAAPRFHDALFKAVPTAALDPMSKLVGIVQVLVQCGVVDPVPGILQRDPLLLVSSGDDDMPVDAAAFRGAIPSVAGIQPVTNIVGQNARKLFGGNMSHASLAYLGAQRGYVGLEECVADPEVLDEVFAAIDEATYGLQEEYGFRAEEMTVWNIDLKKRMSVSTPGDTVARVAADPIRKLGRNDRLVGPALLAWRHGLDPVHLVRVIAAALHYRNPNDSSAVNLEKQIGIRGVEAAARDICGLDAGEAGLLELIVRAFESPVA